MIKDTNPELDQELKSLIGLANALAYNFWKLRKSKYTLDEIQSAAYLGVSTAINNFDRDRGVKITTFAIKYIKGHMLQLTTRDKWYNEKRSIPLEKRHLMFSELVQVDNDGSKEKTKEFGFFELGYSKVLNSEFIDSLMSDLSYKEKQVIKLAFYEELSQASIARILKSNQVQISRIKRKALAKMKHTCLENNYESICI